MNYIKKAKDEGWSFKHSHFILNGKLYKNRACYSDFTYNTYIIKDLVVLHPFPEQANHEYINWIINESNFKEHFANRSVDRAIKYGFKINLGESEWACFPALAALRLNFEFHGSNFPWQVWRDKGFDEYESLYLTHQYSVSSDGSVTGNRGNSNHLPYSKDTYLYVYRDRLTYTNPLEKSITLRIEKLHRSWVNTDNISGNINDEMSIQKVKKKLEEVDSKCVV